MRRLAWPRPIGDAAKHPVGELGALPRLAVMGALQIRLAHAVTKTSRANAVKRMPARRAGASVEL